MAKRRDENAQLRPGQVEDMYSRIGVSSSAEESFIAASNETMKQRKLVRGKQSGKNDETTESCAESQVLTEPIISTDRMGKSDLFDVDHFAERYANRVRELSEKLQQRSSLYPSTSSLQKKEQIEAPKTFLPNPNFSASTFQNSSKPGEMFIFGQSEVSSTGSAPSFSPEKLLPPAPTVKTTTETNFESKSKDGEEAVIRTTDYVLDGFKWVGLRKIKYRDPLGKIREWESCFRTTRDKNDPLDAVYIVAEKEEELVVVAQFRPATGTHVIEFPAGLVDKSDQDASAAALRELEEETGYKGIVTREGPPTFSDPGVLDACQAFINVKVDTVIPPKVSNDEGEFIETFTLPLKDLSKSLKVAALARGAVVDGALYAFGQGLERGAELARKNFSPPRAGVIRPVFGVRDAMMMFGGAAVMGLAMFAYNSFQYLEGTPPVLPSEL